MRAFALASGHYSNQIAGAAWLAIGLSSRTSSHSGPVWFGLYRAPVPAAACERVNAVSGLTQIAALVLRFESNLSFLDILVECGTGNGG